MPESSPLYAQVRYTRGVILDDYYDISKERAKLEEVILCYDQAIRSKPDFAEAMYNRVYRYTGLTGPKMRWPALRGR